MRMADRFTRKPFCLLLCLVGLLLTTGQAGAAGIKTDILTISGEITAQGRTKGPIVVEVYQRPQLAPRPVYSTVISRPGPYEIRVRPGTYYLRAFVDENRNQIQDPGEPAGIHAMGPGAASPAEAQAGPAAQAVILLANAPKKGINIKIDIAKPDTDIKKEVIHLRQKMESKPVIGDEGEE